MTNARAPTRPFKGDCYSRAHFSHTHSVRPVFRRRRRRGRSNDARATRPFGTGVVVTPHTCSTADGAVFRPFPGLSRRDATGNPAERNPGDSRKSRAGGGVGAYRFILIEVGDGAVVVWEPMASGRATSLKRILHTHTHSTLHVRTVYGKRNNNNSNNKMRKIFYSQAWDRIPPSRVLAPGSPPSRWN